MSAPYNGTNMVLLNPATNPYKGEQLIGDPVTTSWYATQNACLRTDPTVIARRHTFPDAPIPKGVPDTAVPPVKVCLSYMTTWPAERVAAGPMIEAERNHPQFAFSPGGPGTVSQIDMESQLRRLDQPLTNCQAVLADDAPLYYNTVAPPPSTGLSIGVQNATNPISSIIRSTTGCREAADAMASAMSGRWINNATRQDTMRFQVPFTPPGIGVGAPRGPGGLE